MQITTFNSGRGYDANGQVISYTILPSGFLQFWDHSRHIEGAMRWKLQGIEVSPRDTQRILMNQYDSDNAWNETCDSMTVIGRADYYVTLDALKAAR